MDLIVGFLSFTLTTNRYEDIVLFRSLASHRIILQMQEKQRARAQERRAARQAERRRRRVAKESAKQGRGRSSAESSTDDLDGDEMDGDDDYDDNGNSNSNGNGDTTVVAAGGKESKTGSGTTRSTLYRWTAGWIFGKEDSSSSGKDNGAEEDNLDLEKLFEDAQQGGGHDTASGTDTDGDIDTSILMTNDTKSKTKGGQSTATTSKDAVNEVVILHIFVEHGQMQLSNAPTPEALAAHARSRARRTLRTIAPPTPTSFLSLQFSEFSLEKRDESMGTRRSCLRLSLKSLSATDLTSESELFSHIFLPQHMAELAQQQIRWVRAHAFHSSMFTQDKVDCSFASFLCVCVSPNQVASFLSMSTF